LRIIRDIFRKFVRDIKLKGDDMLLKMTDEDDCSRNFYPRINFYPL